MVGSRSNFRVASASGRVASAARSIPPATAGSVPGRLRSAAVNDGRRQTDVRHVDVLTILDASSALAPDAATYFIAWGIALAEYCLAVPANRWGSAVYSTAQLKTMQEIITLIVFVGFSLAYLKEPIGWNHALGFALISAGAFFVFQKW